MPDDQSRHGSDADAATIKPAKATTSLVAPVDALKRIDLAVLQSDDYRDRSAFLVAAGLRLADEILGSDRTPRGSDRRSGADRRDA